MTTRRRILVAVGAISLVFALAYALLHAAGVQKPVFAALAQSFEEQTGWTIGFDEPRLRLWPARFTADNLVLSADGRELATVEHVTASWRWSAVVGAPRRITELRVRGLVVDLENPPPLPERVVPPDEQPVDPWRLVEIGRLVVEGTGGVAGTDELVGIFNGLRVEGGLEHAEAKAVLGLDSLAVERSDRRIDLGSARVAFSADSAGVVLEDAVFEGGTAELRATGELAAGEGPSGHTVFRFTADVADLAEWWDPNLASGLALAGVIELDGRATLAPDGGLEIETIHDGQTLSIAGYDLEELELGLISGVPTIRAAGAGWGSAAVEVVGPATASIEASLDRAPVDRLLAFTAPRAASAVGSPVHVSGEIAGSLSVPFTTDTLEGGFDLRVDSPLGRVLLRGEGSGREWEIDEARVEHATGAATLIGRIGPGDAVEVGVDLRISNPDQFARTLGSWLPAVAAIEAGGGPIQARFDVAGTLRSPEISGRAAWQTPELAGRRFDGITAEIGGNFEGLRWAADASAPGVELKLEGLTDPVGLATEGGWTLEIDDLPRSAALVEGLPVSDDGLSGVLSAAGDFEAGADRWRLGGDLEGRNLAWEGWMGESLRAGFSADADGLRITKILVETLGGTIGGAGSIGWEGPPSPVEAFLEWRDLDLGRMPMEIPAAAAGLCSGELEIAGSLAQPTGAVDIRWRTGVDGSLPELRAVGGLEDGVVRIATDEIVIPRGSGTLTAEGELPIGLLARPDWLWPEAPDHDARISLQGRGLDSAELLELFGRPAHEVGITGDLELEAEWRPNRPEETRAFVEVRSARFRHRGGEIVADRPIVLKAAGTRVVLEPMILKGRVSRVEIEAGADLATGALEGTLDAVLAPGFGRNIPYPVQIHEPVSVAAELGGTTRRPRVALRMSHPGGALVFRDPPLRIRDLVLDAEVVDGTLWIKDGRARVNQGTMEIGGGWDPVNRQGVVAEFENVVVFVGGILSQWTGAVAVEPEPDRLAKVVGEVNLVAGLWDQNVRLGGALFGPQAIEPAADDPLNEISLDLDVRGRGIVRVENNLGRFDARWDVLRVTGVAARPRLNGEIRISPGGRFSLAGQRVRVRRGGLLFTGDPDVDPIVEIVPESDFAVFGDEEGQVSTTALATQGLVEGIAGAFGFENETLQPAEISVDLERESSQQLKLGQRLSHNVALFFATNTTDVQDRTSMLQFWNLPGLHGLAVQGYQQTLTDEYGANLIQRFQWGGSPTWEDRPTIRKLALEGGWPLGKRRLRRAVGFRKGQPFDPFLEFVAQVRLERELAEAGYQEARVTATSVEANNAWTMIFECDPGPQQTVDFEGDVPARRVREEVTALYRHPPLEGLGFRNMAMLIERHFGAEGYPDAVVLVERRDDRVVAEVARQGLTDLTGPVLAGVPEEVEASVVKRLGGPAELALLSADPARAAGVIQKTLIDLGFRDATVRSVETVPLGSERGEVRAEVDLGPQAVVAEVVVTGSDPLGVTGGDAFSLKVGSPLDRLSVDLAASRIRAQYDAAGYSDAVVRGAAEQTDDGSWIVTVDLEPGIRRVLTGIEVNGLKHTSRRSIVAGMTINEGEILRNSDLDTTAVRVANFAPIDRLDVRTVPEGADGAKVELDVVEKDRWTAEVGGGWSTERGIQARLGLRDDNLLGRGFGLNLRGRWDRVEWLGFLVASLPPLPGKKLAFTSTIGFSRGEPPDGDSDLISDETVWSIEATRWLGGGELAAGTAGEQVTAYYRFTRTHTYDKVPPDPDDWWIFPIDITTDIGLLGARYVRDRFDAPFDPTRGYGIFIDAGTSSELLGSDFEYWTALATGSTATGIFGSTTWVQSVRLGVAEPLHGQNLIEEVKFFAGGQGSIRGFDRNSVGPVTYGQNDWVPAGGGALAILNEELRIPIKGGFRAAVFADVGQIWESWGVADGNLAVGAGIGIRWATPIGPLWADVAWPVVNPYIEPPGEPPYPYPIRRMSSSKPKFYLGIGRPF